MYLLWFLPFLLFAASDKKSNDVVILADYGKQPKAFMDESQIIRLVYGYEDNIYYKESSDKAKTFSQAKLVAGLREELMLGMGRGPQIASSRDFTVISAVDKSGNIYSWRKNNDQENWEGPIIINDVDTVAKEGFVALTAGRSNNFYAVWNDLRSKNNEVYGSISKDGGKTWGKNKLIYSSPDTTICPCCKTSIAFNKQTKTVYVMWRNQLNGFRDMFIAALDENFEKKAQPSKLGKGTWKLDGCPMDGGNLTVDSKGKVLTVWRREGKVFVSEPGIEEVFVEEGRNPVIGTYQEGNIILWNSQNEIMALLPKRKNPVTIGKGMYPNVIASENFVVAFWEGEDGKLMSKNLSNE